MRFSSSNDGASLQRLGGKTNPVASAFNPATATGVTAWWSTASITPVSDGTNVSPWSDIIASAALTQPASNKGGKYYADIRNGNPALLFDGASEYYLSTPTVGSLTSDGGSYVIWVVGNIIDVRTNDATPYNNDALVASIQNENWTLFFKTSDGAHGCQQDGADVTTDLNIAYTENNWALFKVKYDNNTNTFYFSKNGGSLQTANPVSTMKATTKNSAFYVGSGYTAYTNCYVGDLLFADENLSADDEASITTYFKTKWNV